MGTDIHMLVQRRYGEGPWELIDPSEYPEKMDWRNYNLFAILANVRNGFGFGGVETAKETFEPIAEPRGYPDGFAWPDPPLEKRRVPEEIAFRMYEGDWGFSWVTLAELMQVPWGKIITKVGVVDEHVYVNLVPGDRPKGWVGTVWGKGHRTVSIGEYVAGVRGEKETHIQVSWKETYAEAVGAYWMETVMPWLKDQAKGDAEIRLVFGFDS